MGSCHSKIHEIEKFDDCTLIKKTCDEFFIWFQLNSLKYIKNVNNHYLIEKLLLTIERMDSIWCVEDNYIFDVYFYASILFTNLNFNPENINYQSKIHKITFSFVNEKPPCLIPTLETLKIMFIEYTFGNDSLNMYALKIYNVLRDIITYSFFFKVNINKINYSNF